MAGGEVDLRIEAREEPGRAALDLHGEDNDELPYPLFSRCKEEWGSFPNVDHELWAGTFAACVLLPKRRVGRPR
jgi:hypothetical protein